MTAWYLLAVANARNDKPLFKTFCCRSVEADQLRALQMKPIYIYTLCKCYIILLVIYVWLSFVSAFELNVTVKWNGLRTTVIDSTDLAPVGVSGIDLISSNILVATSTSTVLSIKTVNYLERCCYLLLHVKHSADNDTHKGCHWFTGLHVIPLQQLTKVFWSLTSII